MVSDSFHHTVYIAGPYTNGNTRRNVKEAILAADFLTAAGFLPYIPHLCHFWHQIVPHEYEFWMDVVMAWLEKCDCVLRLPGKSEGADRETALALKLGMPVFFGKEYMVDFYLNEGYNG